MNMAPVTTKRFTLAEYHRLIELGFLTEGDRVELIRGELVQMERYSQPYQDSQGSFGYRLKQIALKTETIALPGFPKLLIDLSQVFPG